MGLVFLGFLNKNKQFFRIEFLLLLGKMLEVFPLAAAEAIIIINRTSRFFRTAIAVFNDIERKEKNRKNCILTIRLTDRPTNQPTNRLTSQPTIQHVEWLRHGISRLDFRPDFYEVNEEKMRSGNAIYETYNKYTDNNS